MTLEQYAYLAEILGVIAIIVHIDLSVYSGAARR